VLLGAIQIPSLDMSDMSETLRVEHVENLREELGAVKDLKASRVVAAAALKPQVTPQISVHRL
jgi:hypothetical protein